MRGGSLLKPVGFALLVLLLMPSWLGGESAGSLRSYPLPKAEVERILVQWLIDSGYQVSTPFSTPDQVQLKAHKENERWLITIKAQSPLACSIEAEHTLHGQPNPSKPNELWTYLESYTRSLSPGHRKIESEIPPSVLSQTGVVVCIKARTGNEVLQFTGFIVSRKGFILSTAHDLKEIQEMRVMPTGGRELQGRLLKKDPHRDLSLIKVDFPFDVSLDSVGSGPPLPQGERVYAICCTGDRETRILSGTISGPPRIADRLPLWPVNMEIPRGSSGAPIFDGRGNLVSMVKGRYRGTQSLGFLIPKETMRSFLEESR